MDSASLCVGAMVSTALSLTGYASMCFFTRYRETIKRLAPFMGLAVTLTVILYFVTYY